uniref:Uncharacterized protein n=1 Tax=Cacopsylla melanoneura TaxID=428564 RepID=A0A8D8ZCK1_9HEMI
MSSLQKLETGINHHILAYMEIKRLDLWRQVHERIVKVIILSQHCQHLFESELSGFTGKGREARRRGWEEISSVYDVAKAFNSVNFIILGHRLFSLIELHAHTNTLKKRPTAPPCWISKTFFLFCC